MYGRDGRLERLLADLEGTWSVLLRAIDEIGTPPPLLSGGHRDVLFFLALQRGRTLEAAAAHREALEKMDDFKQRAYAELGRSAPAEPDLSQIDHVLRSLQINLHAWSYLLDLKLTIVTSDAAQRFVASDAPVSFHNDALYDLPKGGATAYSSPGLIVFLPISPNRGLLLFDRNMYVLSDRTTNVVHASSADVAALNTLTAANATQVLYYNPNQPEAEVRGAFERGGRIRPPSRSVTFETTIREEGGTRKVLAFSPSCARFRMNLSFLTTLPKRAARMRTLLLQRPFPRHPELTCWLEGYDEVAPGASEEQLMRALQEGHGDLFSRLREGRRAFIGQVASARIPGMNKDVFRAFPD